MKVSYNWLRSWVPVDWPAEEVAERLTAAGLEVDRVTQSGIGLDGVVVAEIVECRPHPDADRLSVCRVDRGHGQTHTVVCGAPNARAGLKAPLAVAGSRLPGGLEIKQATVRGVDSEGMLCSEPELALGDDAAGLMELPDDAPVGSPLAEFLKLPDSVIEFDLTPNRGDCLSVRGLARELSALAEVPARGPQMDPVAAVTERTFAIDLQAPADCPRYVGRVIEGIDPAAKTPLWMTEALRRSGLRSLGPTVDVTNYVLLELGQPMHAFDLDRLEGGIRVRRPLAGDRITLLDGQEIEPEPDMLLICDHRRPVALAGVMGGADSAVSGETQAILLESAWFNPATIVGRARRLGVSSESAHRFERGVDPQLQVLAVERATRLLLEIAGGRPGPVMDVTVEDQLPPIRDVKLRLDRVNRLLGTRLTGTEVRTVLTRLGMTVRGSNQEFEIRPPGARRDIEIEADLIEEVARMVGYDRLPVRVPGGRLKSTVPSECRVERAALQAGLQARGFQEVMTWSFVSADELGRLGLESGSQPLANPLSQDLAILRTSLLPGLLKTAVANRRRQQGRMKLFELGHIFLKNNSGFLEMEKLGLLICGDPQPESWANARRAPDFFDLKGEVEQLLAGAGRLDQAQFQSAQPDWLHPGQAATLTLDRESAGWLGQLHPRLVRELDLSGPVYVAELDLERLRQRPLPEYRGLARFPSVRRDLALVVPDELPVAELVSTCRETAGERLENWIIFDQYRGEGIEAGCKSIAIGLIIRDVSRTLTDHEVDDLVERIVDQLAARHHARLRG